jgi:uncharacterized membrane protein YGL010W
MYFLIDPPVLFPFVSNIRLFTVAITLFYGYSFITILQMLRSIAMLALLILTNLKAKQLFDVSKLSIILLSLVVIRIATLIRLICSELNHN